MPKVKSTKRAVVAKLVEEFGCDVLSGDEEILECIDCDMEMSYGRKSNTIAQLKKPKHRNNLQDNGIHAWNKVHNTVDAPKADRKQFNLELCEALVNANITIWKLENNLLKGFWKSTQEM